VFLHSSDDDVQLHEHIPVSEGAEQISSSCRAVPQMDEHLTALSIKRNERPLSHNLQLRPLLPLLIA
jgi:hypothetical protein